MKRGPNIPRTSNPPPDTAAFKRWFKRSKVVTATGEPMIVYHGTRSPVEFDTFATGTQTHDDEVVISGSRDPGSSIGPHFTESAAVASDFARGKAADWDRKRVIREGHVGGRVIPVYLSIQKPMVLQSDDELIEYIWAHGRSSEVDSWGEAVFEVDDQTGRFYSFDTGDVLTDAEANKAIFEKMMGAESDGDGLAPAEYAAWELGTSVRDHMKKLGYDGVKYRNTIEGGGWSWIAFDAWQVKSAYGNVGTYSRRSRSLTR